MSGKGGAGYPQQAYPQGYVQGPPQGPPPPYHPGYVQQGQQGQQFPPQYYQGYPTQAPVQPQQHPAYLQQQPQMQYYGAPPTYTHQQHTVMMQGGFDAGARFGANNAHIPPTPPGCLPNAAQMAAASGHNVVVTQRPKDFFTGGSDGGYVIW